MKMIDSTLVEYDFIVVKMNLIKTDLKILEQAKNEDLFLETRKEADDLLNEIKKYGISRANTDKQIKTAEGLNVDYKTTKRNAYYLSTIGALMSLWGFLVWGKIQQKELTKKFNIKILFNNKKDGVFFITLFIIFVLFFAKFYLDFNFFNLF